MQSFACILVGIVFASSLAASNLEWARNYNGIGDDPDRIAAITTDDAGHIYVLATSTLAGTGNDLITIKFGSSGDTLWSRAIDYPTAHSETAVAITLSENGDIVVTGKTYSEADGYDVITAMLTSAGDVLWLRSFAGAVHGDDIPVAVVCDRSSNVFVTASTATQLGYPAREDIVTIKYNGSGVEQWVRQYHIGEAHLPRDIATDSSGSVYVTGSCMTIPGSPGPHSTTLKYLHDGTLAWVRMASDPAPDSYTFGLEVEVDAEQNLYVASSLIEGYNIHAMITKYTGIGDTLWQRVHLREQPRWESGIDMTLMPNGGVGLTSSTSDVLTACYSEAGDTLWSRRWLAGQPGYHQTYACAVADNGDVFVSACTGTSNDYHQVVTLGYSAFGDSLFIGIDSIGGYYRGEGIDVSVSPDGSIYTGCKIATASTEDIGLLKYSPGGTLEWKAHYTGLGSADDDAAALVIDQADNAYAVGTTCDLSCDIVIIKYAPNGSELWRSVFDGVFHGDDYAVAAVLEPGGHLIVLGSVQTASSPFGDALRDFWIAKYSEAGDTIWTRTVDGAGAYPADDASDIAVDSTGHIYVTGDSQGIDEDFLTVKFDPSGSVIWTRRYNGPGDGEDHAEAIAVGPGGDVFVTGSSDGGMENDDILTVMYNPDGIQQWVNRYDAPPGGEEDSGEDIAVGPDSLPCVTGQGGDALIVLKYKANGDTLWSRIVESPIDGLDFGKAIDIDESGSIFVGGALSAGSSDCSYQAFDAVVFKYSDAGQLGWMWKLDNSELCSNQITRLCADQQGGAFAIGWNGYPSEFLWDEWRKMFAVHVLANGTTAWTVRYEGTDAGYAAASDLSLDQVGKLFVVGQTLGIGSKSDITTLKLRQTDTCGDADGSGIISISDVVYLINYIFGGGPAPNPIDAGDVDCNGIANISDAVYLINYIFGGGPEPCAACP